MNMFKALLVGSTLLASYANASPMNTNNNSELEGNASLSLPRYTLKFRLEEKPVELKHYTFPFWEKHDSRPSSYPPCFYPLKLESGYIDTPFMNEWMNQIRTYGGVHAFVGDEKLSKLYKQNELHNTTKGGLLAIQESLSAGQPVHMLVTKEDESFVVQFDNIPPCTIQWKDVCPSNSEPETGNKSVAPAIGEWKDIWGNKN